MRSAVITADMVNSTQFPSDKTRKWLNELIKTLSTHPDLEWTLKPEIYRGDSFQGVLKDAGKSLHAALLARTIMRSHSAKTDLRVAIGIGSTDLITSRAGTSDGEAFRLSGRLADQMRDQRAKIAIALPTPSGPLTAVLDLLETLVNSWTIAQSDVITGLLQNENITQIAERHSISQSAVSQRVAAAKWWALENFLKTFPDQLTLYTKPDPKP